MPDLYIPGDHYRICDRTGFKVRASRTRKEWTGAIVRDLSWEARHSQDFVRGRADRQTVVDARPDSEPEFTGPPDTALSVAASAGAASVTVETVAGFAANDRIRVMLDCGEAFLTSIGSIVGQVFAISPSLPAPASAGNVVTGEA